MGGPPDVGDVVRVGPFVAGGQAFVIDCNIPERPGSLADRLRDLRGEAVDAEPTVLLVARRGPDWLTHPWGVWRDGEPCQTTVTAEYITAYVLWEVTRLVLGSSAPLMPVHAAAVVRDGRALVLAGVSHAGKSTLSGWLTAHGWAFLTDEVALLETGADGTTSSTRSGGPSVCVGPGPLDGLFTVPNGDSEVLVPASELGPLAESAPLTAIVFPSYQKGGGERGAGATASRSRRSASWPATCRPWVRRGRGVPFDRRRGGAHAGLPARGRRSRCGRGDARRARRRGDRRMTTVDDRAPGARTRRSRPRSAGRGGAVRRPTGQVHELNPSASAVWLLLDGVATLDDVVDELHELLGVAGRPAGRRADASSTTSPSGACWTGPSWSRRRTPTATTTHPRGVRRPARRSVLARPPDP